MRSIQKELQEKYKKNLKRIAYKILKKIFIVVEIFIVECSFMYEKGKT